MNPFEILLNGCQILDPLMNSCGFTFIERASGKSSGGNFASGEYIKDDRRLELHFRHSLGLVTYHISDLSLSHESYMRALLGLNGGNKYPGFSNDPLDAFRGLSYDLEHYCSDFLKGSGEEFKRCVVKAREQEKVSGFKALSKVD
jgi:hypothetical protein